MSPGEAVICALAMEPDRPGVARLCQELLSVLSGITVTHRPAKPIRLIGANQIGNVNNPRRGAALRRIATSEPQARLRARGGPGGGAVGNSREDKAPDGAAKD